VVPFIRVMDSLTLAISQGSLRRGSAAVYLPVNHPEIEEFIEIRRPTGGDPNRKAMNLHHGLLISDAFMRAVENDEEWALVSPKDGAVQRTVSARALWIRILTARVETGEPYLVFVDHVNNARPEHHKLAGLEVKTSNLCSEITLPTGIDHHGKQRTAVCCLSSLNLESYLEWHEHPHFIGDVMRFLDNVLQGFIDTAGSDFARATYAAMRERSVGLGVMGFHSFLQANGIPLESVMAKVWNKKMFKHIRAQCDEASLTLGKERGACPDAADFGFQDRFSNKLAIAPTASISIICGGASPGIEPSAANVYNHKTLSGSFVVRNPYLEKVLAQKGKNDEDTWTAIMTDQGSVRNVDCLDDHEKAVFKTAFEIDQRWLIEHAADRTPYICQSQSLNIFLPADVHKRDLHQIHMMAWKRGVKSLYYCRSSPSSALRASRAKPSPHRSATMPLRRPRPMLPLLCSPERRRHRAMTTKNVLAASNERSPLPRLRRSGGATGDFIFQATHSFARHIGPSRHVTPRRQADLQAVPLSVGLRRLADAAAHPLAARGSAAGRRREGLAQQADR
jgi:ribonucleoside-diphosphate reductase alpha chain